MSEDPGFDFDEAPSETGANQPVPDWETDHQELGTEEFVDERTVPNEDVFAPKVGSWEEPAINLYSEFQEDLNEVFANSLDESASSDNYSEASVIDELNAERILTESSLETEVNELKLNETEQATDSWEPDNLNRAFALHFESPSEMDDLQNSGSGIVADLDGEEITLGVQEESLASNILTEAYPSKENSVKLETLSDGEQGKDQDFHESMDLNDSLITSEISGYPIKIYLPSEDREEYEEAFQDFSIFAEGESIKPAQVHDISISHRGGWETLSTTEQEFEISESRPVHCDEAVPPEYTESIYELASGDLVPAEHLEHVADFMVRPCFDCDSMSTRVDIVHHEDGWVRIIVDVPPGVDLIKHRQAICMAIGKRVDEMIAAGELPASEEWQEEWQAVDQKILPNDPIFSGKGTPEDNFSAAYAGYILNPEALRERNEEAYRFMQQFFTERRQPDMAGLST